MHYQAVSWLPNDRVSKCSTLYAIASDGVRHPVSMDPSMGTAAALRHIVFQRCSNGDPKVVDIDKNEVERENLAQ